MKTRDHKHHFISSSSKWYDDHFFHFDTIVPQRSIRIPQMRMIARFKTREFILFVGVSFPRNATVIGFCGTRVSTKTGRCSTLKDASMSILRLVGL